MAIPLLLIVSCKKNISPEEFITASGPLALSVDKPTVVLMQRNDAADAMVFSWTTGTNLGTNAAISYTLMIDKQGANFSNPMTIALGNAVLSRKFSVKALNDSLIRKWNLPADVDANMEAKVISRVADDVAPGETSNTVAIKLKPYKAVTTNLFLIGDATPNGWNASGATPLTALPGQPGKFSWIGNLSAGEFKFITSLGQFLPSYNRGATNTALVYRTENAQADNKFIITTPGAYNIAVDLLNLSVSITAETLPPYSQLWVVGDATPNGWNIANPNSMRVDSSNLWVFHFNEVLKAGEFKIPVSTGSFSTDYYMPLVNNPAITATGVQFIRGGSPDNKWKITTPGPYKIRLNLQTSSIDIKPFTPYTRLWMVGNATPAGWNINNPTPFTPVVGDPYKFEYTGPMSAGEFKIPVATGNFATDYFMPVINRSTVGSTQMKFVPGGTPDHKWVITQAGNYKITIDQLRETISIQKL